MKLNKYEKIFIDIANRYVKRYDEKSFQFYFDNNKLELIGTSKSIVEVKITSSEEVFKRIL